jgi:Fic family protein
MGDLVAFANRADLPVLAHTALAHAQFETIHPFPDGNGRTGRALVQAMLRHHGLTTGTTIPVSAGLLSSLESYFGALAAWRDGDPDPIVSVFAAATLRGLSSARTLAGELSRLHDDWGSKLSSLRIDAAARRLATATIGQPVLNVRVAMEMTGVSQPQASNALNQLVERAILTPANSKRRNRTWVNQDVISALDEFAAGATRQRPI